MEVADGTGLYEAVRRARGASIDTRTLQAGEAFFALKGAQVDGNRFARAALEKGAAPVVIDAPAVACVSDPRVWVVPDVLTAMQNLARLKRREWGKTLVAITGSNGKTTTKELARAAFAVEQKVFVTPGNLNNHIGLPLALLRMAFDVEIALLELGDNRKGDIAELCAIAEPDAALITNLGLDHIGFYGSMEANAAGKLELFDYVASRGGVCFINGADVYLKDYPAPNKILFNVPVGLYITELAENSAGICVTMSGAPLLLPLTVESALPGRHNAENIMAAAAVALYYGVSPAGVARGASAYVPQNNRGQRMRVGRFDVWLDAYNANPNSMAAAIRAFFAASPAAPCLVLGGMNELGAFSEKLHADLADVLNEFTDYTLVCFGEDIKTMFVRVETALAKCWFEKTNDALPLLPTFLQETQTQTVLLKGSRSYRLEELLPVFSITPEKNETIAT